MKQIVNKNDLNIMLNEPKRQPIRNWVRLKFRDFLKHNTKVEIHRSQITNEPVLSVWMFGFLIWRRRFDYSMQEWVELGPNEYFY